MRVDRIFALAFEALQTRWDQTTETDHAERQQIIEELRRVSVDWQRVLEARERERRAIGSAAAPR